MKIMWNAGAVLAAALVVAACGDGGGDAAKNGSAGGGNTATPAAAGGNASGGNTSGAADGGEAGGGEQAGGAGAQQDFTVVNSTGQAVMTLNVSPSDENAWGPDILGRDVLGNGEQAQIQFARGQEQCNWDIRVTYEDGETGDWRGINLCETATVTLTAE